MPELDPDTIAHLPVRSTLDGRSYVAESGEKKQTKGGEKQVGMEDEIGVLMLIPFSSNSGLTTVLVKVSFLGTFPSRPLEIGRR